MSIRGGGTRRTSGITRSSDDRPDTSKSTVKPPYKKKTGDDSCDIIDVSIDNMDIGSNKNDSFFNKCIKGAIDPPNTGYSSSPPNNSLSTDSKDLESAKAILRRVEELKYTTFVPITTLSKNPSKNGIILKVSGFPPDDEFQNIANDGPCTTRVLVGVTPAPGGEDVYEYQNCTQQNPSYHAVSTVDNRVIGRHCNITEARAQVATTESTSYLDIHPFPGPHDQADERNRKTDRGKKYWEMRDAFDRLVMAHILEIIESNLLPIEIITIHGSQAWDFFTVKFPKEFPVQYQNTIRPLIIQHSPIMHGTAIVKGPTYRQGYTYIEHICNVADHLQGSRDYHKTLIEKNLPGNIFAFLKTKNDNKEGNDHFYYMGRFIGYDGDGDEDDNTILVARNLTHLCQLLSDEEDGVGCGKDNILNQDELKKAPHIIQDKRLSIEVHHFLVYVEQQGRQMKFSDFGFQNREGAYKAWKEQLAEDNANKQLASKKAFQGKKLGVFSIKNWKKGK